MKRIAGIFLAALLALTVLPHGAELVTSDDVTKGIVTTAYAEENTITISSDTTWDENCEYFVRATSLGGMDYIKLPGNLVVNSGATLTIAATVYLAGDATISGSGTIKRGADFGGAMFRIENRTLTIEGNVTFDGSSSGDVYRSVIEIPSRGVVNLKSGTICNNNISYNGYDTNMIGGGVWVGATGTLNMTGGTITGNEASYGGGVYAYGTINMSGGEIKNNTARVDGGGAYISNYNGSVFQVSKTATIKGNYKAGTDNNVYLEENRKIEVVEALTQGAEVVVNSGSTSQITGSGNYSMTENTEDGSVTLKAPTGGEQPGHVHAWSAGWATNETAHWHVCTALNCPVTDNAQMRGYETHTAGAWETVVQPTDTADGKKQKKCTECGYVMEEETIPATGGGQNPGGEVTPGTGTTPRYYYNATASADAKADGSKTGSPKTFDAGVGIYAVSAVLSLTGMAYVGKKKF